MSALLNLLLACRIIEMPAEEKPAAPLEQKAEPAAPEEKAGKPAEAEEVPVSAPPSSTPAEGASKNDAPAEGLSTGKNELRMVAARQSLLWVGPNPRGSTRGLLRQGQLLLVGTEAVKTRWRDREVSLLPAKTMGGEGWVIAEDLAAVSLPVWAVAMRGPFDPFENPERLCETLAPDPWVGGEFRLLGRAGGDRLRYEAGCLERAEDGNTTAATRQGLASALDFAVVRQANSCAQKLEALGSTSEALAVLWPLDPALCDLLKISPVDPPFPDSKTTWSIDLTGGDHPAEGYLVDGRWIQTSILGGRRVFDGPDYVLVAYEQNGRFKVLRLGWDPPSAMEVLDRPSTGEGAEVVGAKGLVTSSDGTRCEWLPGRRQYYRCR